MPVLWIVCGVKDDIVFGLVDYGTDIYGIVRHIYFAFESGICFLLLLPHNGVYSRGTVKGVISDMCECLVEQLLNGNRIQLGELGTFGISISSEGAESLEKFTLKNIKAVNILFAPGADFENLVGRAEFNCVASRAAQVAVLKVEKTGAETLNMVAIKNKGTGTSPDKPSCGSDDSGEGGDDLG